ncbi:MAG: bifunctional alpha,alpha-trehalose-phosphate synthase (UDP-forming)/trehalose-phosphatase [Gammaproteobacteria bacterium]|nr:MAG: bifunctional alpha,alpha-trehalose-phosphate synthase (UDP-forming)/trehalose-phosphatase [Gammaproteobacteria bacterium]
MRLILVSNRLPFTITQSNEKTELRHSIGGLATGLNAFTQHLKKSENMEIMWVGWPGADIQDDTVYQELINYACHPVLIPEKLMERFYTGFCNQTLWPLFHYMPSYASYYDDDWQAYETVNQLFSNALCEVIKPGDVVWVHDYHLLLLPNLIRHQFPHLPIGFFLHISFPSFEIFQFLPKRCRDDILYGMLGADLIGFHTHEYSQHFLKATLRSLGYEQHLGLVSAQNRFIKIDTYPMGIDFNYIQDRLKNEEVITEKAKLLADIKNSKIILSVDRLDYTKGIFNRLTAYQLFLENNPQWLGKVVLIAIVAPSREEIDQYRLMKKEINELIGYINGKFGNTHWTPILYQYKVFSLDQLIALYSISDVALITPLRDGMNLIAKEYLATKIDKKGVLILSETAGAAKELVNAIIINPNCVLEIANALKQALEMNEYEQTKRLTMMQYLLKRYDLIHWGTKFINDLFTVREEKIRHSEKSLNKEMIDKIISKYNVAEKRLILLDYDGTLTPLMKQPQLAAPSVEILQILSALSKDKKNKIVIISGRDKNTLEKWLGHLNIILVAEHSAWLKENSHWQLTYHFNCGWKKDILSILEIYKDRLPGSFIEEKDFSIVWHYRNANEIDGEQVARELIDYLITLTATEDIKVMTGKKIIEIKNARMGKNFAVNQLMATISANFILAIGDDISDEDMFISLPHNAFSIKVGMEMTRAKFNVRLQNDVISLLQSINRKSVI